MKESTGKTVCLTNSYCVDEDLKEKIERQK